ncbi:hypothetical protein NQ318_020046 [Aromia moschata]|uniref:Secreted protein n=1 Tax=Aromia moschata TaxID=1265417 RepID=A0AAV8Z967_9CUCU|nr:hypothetical protein NQ318_020046 [Aromia moschata]
MLLTHCSGCAIRSFGLTFALVVLLGTFTALHMSNVDRIRAGRRHGLDAVRLHIYTQIPLTLCVGVPLPLGVLVLLHAVVDVTPEVAHVEHVVPHVLDHLAGELVRVRLHVAVDVEVGADDAETLLEHGDHGAYVEVGRRVVVRVQRVGAGLHQQRALQGFVVLPLFSSNVITGTKCEGFKSILIKHFK